MDNQNIEDTSPLKTESNAKPKRRIFLKIVIGLGIILVGALAGSGIGYYAGLDKRIAAQKNTVALTATTQFQLALADQAAGNLNNARQRIEYVIQIDPSYPGAVDKLTEIMMASSMIATPTAIATAAPTPTEDLRGAEEVFAQAKQLLAASQWAGAVDTLDNLRKINREFRAIEVDGMYYIGLRNRGMDKIMNGSLEEGIYDFTLTERFGPLDKDANAYRNWCRLYINGASFWGLDWEQVVNAFADIYPSVPNLRDGSGWTAVDRYRIASVKLADQYAASGDYCSAEYYYVKALENNDDQLIAPTATAIYKECHPEPTDTPEPEYVEPTSETIVTTVAPDVTETVTPTDETSPTEESTVTGG